MCAQAGNNGSNAAFRANLHLPSTAVPPQRKHIYNHPRDRHTQTCYNGGALNNVTTAPSAIPNINTQTITTWMCVIYASVIFPTHTHWHTNPTPLPQVKHTRDRNDCPYQAHTVSTGTMSFTNCTHTRHVTSAHKTPDKIVQHSLHQ